MKLKHTICSLLLTFPFTALASGQQVIFVGLWELFLTLVFLIIVWTLKWNTTGKLLIILIFLLSTYLTFHFIETGAYFENFMRTNIALAIVPSAVVYVSYLILKNKLKKY